MRSIINYFIGVKEELSKVIWPKAAVVAKLTLIVFIISLGVGAYLGVLDLGFVKLVELAIK
ncbi:MAG: preprotein translocase subunit SecE [Patescibacteria group bacterium]